MILLLFTILWMFFIFYMSNKPAIKSTEISNGFIENTIIKVYKIFDRNAKEEQLNMVVEKLSFPVRKLAHFTIYLILGLVVYLTIAAFDKNYSKIFIASLFICIIYAISDEIHQMFVVGRSGEIKDVLIDSIGSLVGIYLIRIINKISFRSEKI